MTLILDAKRRVTLPPTLVKSEPGDVWEAVYDEQEDEILLRRIKRKRKSWIEVWKECPVPMDDLPPRSREMPKKVKL